MCRVHDVDATKAALARALCSHPDFHRRLRSSTESASRLLGRFAGCTAGQEFHLSPHRGFSVVDADGTDGGAFGNSGAASLLREVLGTYLTELRGEIVDTDNSEFKRKLRHERELLDAIAKRLAESPPGDEPTVIQVVRVTAMWA